VFHVRFAENSAASPIPHTVSPSHWARLHCATARGLYCNIRVGINTIGKQRLLMALYNLDLIASSQHISTYHGQHQHSAGAAFHPIDESKELMLKQLLDLSNNYIFNNVNAYFPKSVSLKRSYVKSLAISSTISIAW
jgi:hypothetical protein